LRALCPERGVEVQVLSSACARSVGRFPFLTADRRLGTVSPNPDTAAHDDPYPPPATLGAAVATFFFPVISLIAGLFLLAGEQREVRRSQIRMWIWASVAWMLIQVLVVVLLLGVFSSGGSGGGGPATPVP
jgi:hypothetical protein